MLIQTKKRVAKAKRPPTPDTIKLPNYPGGRPSSLGALRGIVDSDQYDDWLPDPVYYADQRVDEKRTAGRIDRLFEGGILKAQLGESLLLPRYNGQLLRAVALPFDVRICAHIIISAMAPRIAPALARDKVYGFEFKNSEFARPGEGLVDAFNNAIEAALFSTRRGLEILDVRNFNNTASFRRLDQTLQKMGARPDETSFLQQVLLGTSASIATGGAVLGPVQTAANGQGLPSVDDAFAFLYNFYLQPVDQSLARAKANFFRYRDEYFVFDESSRKRIYSELKLAGLDSRVVASYSNFDIKDKLSEQVSRNHKEVSEVLGSFGGGEIVATYQCDTWNEKEKSCVSDSYEVKFKLKESLTDLFRLPKGEGPIDCIQILPILRAINRLRSTGVKLLPPFAGVSEEFEDYRNALQQGRTNWLDHRLYQASEGHFDWQICWLAPLISDLGPLSPPEENALRQVVEYPKASNPAKAQARVALARNSKLPLVSYWAEPNSSYTDYQLRSAMLAAKYLLDRGIEKPWLSMRPLAQSRQPELTNFLFSTR